MGDRPLRDRVTDDEVGWVLSNVLERTGYHDAYFQPYEDPRPFRGGVAAYQDPDQPSRLVRCTCDGEISAALFGMVNSDGQEDYFLGRFDAALQAAKDRGLVEVVSEEGRAWFKGPGSAYDPIPMPDGVGIGTRGALLRLTPEGEAAVERFDAQRWERAVELMGERPPSEHYLDRPWLDGLRAVDLYRLEAAVRKPHGFGERPSAGSDRRWMDVEAAVQRARDTARVALPERSYDVGDEAAPTLLYRGRVLGVALDFDTGEVVATIESEWRPPFAPDVEDWVRVHEVQVAPNAIDPATSLVGKEVRIALERYDDPRDGLAYRWAAAEPAPPLPKVTPDELGWTLSTIADCGWHSAEAGRLGVATTDEVAATIAGWADPDGLSPIETHVRAAIEVAREVGYAVTAYSHELDPTIAEADTQRLIVLTDTGQQACVAWENAHSARNVALLGERPEKASKARAWDIAAGRVDSYRLRYGIEDPRGLGEPSTDRWQSIDRSHVERAIASAGRFIEPPSLGPDLGMGR
jgi:hypothetical protein